MKQVAVIILNWNGMSHGLIRRYLPQVVANTNPDIADVIVADNGSTDDSLAVIAQDFPTVQVIALPQNYGFAEGYNQAIAQVEHPYVVLLNDDVACAPGWLDPMLQYMEQHPDVLGAQPKLKSDRDRKRFEYAGAAGGYLDQLGYPYCRGRIFDVVEEDLGQYDTPCEVDWATGACLMVRREAYQRAGGLDAHFFAHMEEIDLCWRLRRMGGRLMCLPWSEVYHLGGASLSADNPRKTLLNFRNSLLMLYKNLPTSERRGIMLRRKLLDGLAALNFIAHGQFAHAVAIWHAHRQASQMIRDIYAQAPAPSTDFGQAPLGKTNILYRFYIKRQKTFKELI
ncbi:MAG: glycosyltransferase family 2 protein [Bacteroidales bacterium]|nr:glycosyltransferase family 2 protein [Bacteroidales bacterium]